MTLPRLFTRDELREYLGGISSSTLARWIDDGKIPGPLSGTTRWDRAAVKAVDRVRILRTSTLEQLAAVRKEIECG